MFVKLMSDEDAPDDDARKSFLLLEDVIAVGFDREPNGDASCVCHFRDQTTEVFEVNGNVYILNALGEPIDSFGVHPIVTTLPVDPEAIAAETERDAERADVRLGGAASHGDDLPVQPPAPRPYAADDDAAVVEPQF